MTLSIPIVKSISEGNDKIQVCATLMALEDTKTEFTFSMTTMDGTGTSHHNNNVFILYFTAFSGYDYVAASHVHIFISGSRTGDTRCVDITIIDNKVLERNKTFFLTLTVQHPRIILGNAISIITIMDNEC